MDSLRLWRFSGAREMPSKHPTESPTECTDNDSRRLRLEMAEHEPWIIFLVDTDHS
jgi:hypothetical protein